MIKDPIRWFWVLVLCVFACHLSENENYPSHQYHLAEWPSRKLKPVIPLNSTGDILWANELWNWGFTTNVQVIHHTHFNALPIKIEANGVPVSVKGGLYYPAYNLLEGETDSAKSNIALNPFESGYPNPFASYIAPDASIWGPINGNHSPTNAWTYRGSSMSINWYGVDLGEKKFISGVVLEFLESQSDPKCHLPESYFLEYEVGQEWYRLPDQKKYPEKATTGLNLITFPGISLRKIRVVFCPLPDGYSGLLRFQLQGEVSLMPQVIEKKTITRDDVLLSLLEITNPSWHYPISIRIKAGTSWATEIEKNIRVGKMTFFDQEYYLLARSPQLSDGGLNELEGVFELQPREKCAVRLAMAIARDEKSARARVKTWLNKFQPIKNHQNQYGDWFQQNIPYFSCSDGWLTHLYYLRWQNLKRNYYAPGCGYLKFPSFTATRDTYPLYAASFLSGFSNLLQELRWLQEAHWGEDAFRNFMDNMNLNNQLPSVIHVNSIEYMEIPGEKLCKALYQFYLTQLNSNFMKSQLPSMKRHFETSRLNLETDTLVLLSREMQLQHQILKTKSTPAWPESTFKKIQNLFPPVSTYYENCSTIASIADEIGDSRNAGIYYGLTRQIQSLINTNLIDPILQFSPENLWSSTKWLFPLFQISNCLPDSTRQQLWQQFLRNLSTTEMLMVRTVTRDSTENLSEFQEFQNNISQLSVFEFSNYLSFLIDILHEKLADDIEKNYFWHLFLHYATRQNQQFDSLNIRINTEVLPEMSMQTPKNIETFAHTKFTDFVITGIVGLIPSSDQNKIVFDPLVPENALDYFMMERIPYHHHEINVVWDKSGGIDYLDDQLDGFQIYIDRKLQINKPTLQRIEIKLAN